MLVLSHWDTATRALKRLWKYHMAKLLAFIIVISLVSLWTRIIGSALALLLRHCSKWISKGCPVLDATRPLGESHLSQNSHHVQKVQMSWSVLFYLLIFIHESKYGVSSSRRYKIRGNAYHILHELLHQHHLHSNTGQSLGVLCMYIADLFNNYSPIS